MITLKQYWAVKEVLTNLNFDPKFVDLISELNDGVSGDAITPLGNTESFNIKERTETGMSPLPNSVLHLHRTTDPMD